MKKKKAFAFIEMMVVVAIIATMTTLVIISIMNAKASSRDATRKTDLNAIAKAIQSYRIEKNKYPAWSLNSAESWGNLAFCGGTLATNGGPNTSDKNWSSLQSDLSAYLTTLPLDPKEKCTRTNQFLYGPSGYAYHPEENTSRPVGSSFSLWTFLESSSDVANNSKGDEKMTYDSASANEDCIDGQYYKTSWDYDIAWCSSGRNPIAFRQIYTIGAKDF